MIPLAKIYNRTTLNLVTSGTGDLLVILNPWTCFSYAPVLAANNAWFPWLTVNQSAGDLAFQGGTMSGGPFLPQVANVEGFFVDASVMRFQTTLSPLNRQGAVASTVFY